MNTVWSTGEWIFTLPRFELRFYRLCCFGLSLSLSAMQRCAESPLRKEITWILTWLLLLTVLDWMLPGGSEKNGCAVENPELGSPADKEFEFWTWLPLSPILDHWTAGNFARQSCINPSCPFDLSVIARLYCTVFTVSWFCPRLSFHLDQSPSKPLLGHSALNDFPLSRSFSHLFIHHLSVVLCTSHDSDKVVVDKSPVHSWCRSAYHETNGH